jgi:membrane fusion protein, multidrug efflux system
MSKKLKVTILSTFLVLSLIGWFSIWLYGHYYVSTDDAYVNANVVQIAPRVNGRVDQIYVHNNQYIKQGDVLFTLGKASFQASVDSAKAQVIIAEAQLAQASLHAKRTMPLVKQKYLSPQEGDNVYANLKTAEGNLAYAKAGLAQAQLNLAYTTVRAPTSGWISNLNLRAGSIVVTNQPLFALISDEEFWVDANFKETEIGVIKPKQTAVISTDLYPHHPFHGIVESISGGAGTAFSLFPAENATGNWVKVTQRIPTRIRILDPDAKHQLRIGASATVKIKLTS